jgi:hypothetical protein
MSIFRRTVPAREHESCARRFAELEERLEKLELPLAEQQLQLGELLDKVSFRLAQRHGKRNHQPEEDPIDRIIRIRRGNALPER